MNILDIRQSDNWSKYLELYSWRSVRLSTGAILRVRSVWFLRFAKLQRPGVLTEFELAEIDAVCKKNRVLSVKLFPSVGQDVTVLKKFGYKNDTSLDAPPKTLLIDLRKSKEDLWRDLSSGCRYSITRANRYGVRVAIKRAPSLDDIKEFNKLVTARGGKRNFYVQNIKDYAHKARVFGQEAFVVTALDVAGNALGAKLFLGYGKNIAYVHGATTTAGQKSKGGYKLQWDAIMYFKQLGYEELDLEGLYDTRLHKQTQKWRGYSEFKLKFGGEAVEFPLPVVKWFIFDEVFAKKKSRV